MRDFFSFPVDPSVADGEISDTVGEEESIERFKARRAPLWDPKKENDGEGGGEVFNPPVNGVIDPSPDADEDSGEVKEQPSDIADRDPVYDPSPESDIDDGGSGSDIEPSPTVNSGSGGLSGSSSSAPSASTGSGGGIIRSKDGELLDVGSRELPVIRNGQSLGTPGSTGSTGRPDPLK